MIVEQDADRYAYKNGLYVLRQKGNIVEIVNDPSFKPKEWRVEYYAENWLKINATKL